MTLHGKVAFVTGAASGIGAAACAELARRGARLVLFDREAQRVQELAARLGDAALAASGDVTRPDELQQALDQGLARFGALDIAWANAGIASFGPLAQTDAALWQRCVEVNLLGTFHTVRAALPYVLRQRGLLAVTASAASFAHLPGLSAYAASKAAQDAMCNAWRLELEGAGVQVLAIHPSWVDTPLIDEVSTGSTAFRTLRAALPWPMASSTPADALAARIADAMAARRARLCMPAWVATVHLLRGLLHLRPFDAPLRAAAPQVERAFAHDVSALGRAAASGGERARQQLRS